MSRLPWAFKPADHPGWTAHGIVLNNHTATLAALAGRDGLDEAAVAAEVLKVLTPAAIAAALPVETAKLLADELARRLAG